MCLYLNWVLGWMELVADEGMRLTIDYTTSGSQCHPCVSPVAECANTEHGTQPGSGSGHWRIRCQSLSRLSVTAFQQRYQQSPVSIEATMLQFCSLEKWDWTIMRSIVTWVDKVHDRDRNEQCIYDLCFRWIILIAFCFYENYDIALAMSSSRADPVLGHCPGWGYLNI